MENQYIISILLELFIFIVILTNEYQKRKKLERQVKEYQTFVERQEVLLNECWLKLTEISPNYPGLGSLRFRIKRYKTDKSYKQMYNELNDLVKDISECYEGPGVPNEKYIMNRLNEYFNDQQS